MNKRLLSDDEVDTGAMNRDHPANTVPVQPPGSKGYSKEIERELTGHLELSEGSSLSFVPNDLQFKESTVEYLDDGEGK